VNRFTKFYQLKLPGIACCLQWYRLPPDLECVATVSYERWRYIYDNTRGRLLPHSSFM